MSHRALLLVFLIGCDDGSSPGIDAAAGADAAATVDAPVAAIDASGSDAPPPPPSGSLDESFGTGGRAVTTLTGMNEYLYGLANGPDGTIMACGQSANDMVLARFLADGSVDPTWHNGAYAAINLGQNDWLYSMVPLPDGGTVAAGWSFAQAGNTGTGELFQFDATGAPVMSFGGGDAQATLAFNPYAESNTVLRQSDGKLVVIGRTSAVAGSYDALVARFDAAGVLDTSFSQDGVFVLDTGATSDGLYRGVLLPDGSSVAVGSTRVAGVGLVLVVKLDPDGELDPSFDGDGWATYDVGPGSDYAMGAVLGADGRVFVVAGGYQGALEYTRLFALQPDGSLDASFGDAGIATLSLDGTANTLAGPIALQSDGKLVVIAQIATSPVGLGVARLLADGTLDPSFGDGGSTLVPFGMVPTDDDYPAALLIQPDGRILVGGRTTGPGGDGDFTIARFWP